MQSCNLQHLPALLCLLVGLGGGAGDLVNDEDNDDDGDNLLESISFKIENWWLANEMYVD